MAVREQEPMKATLAEIVDEGLSREQKTLPSYLFYDEVGSPLFEQITGLPEYYLTACETEILQSHATEIVGEAGDNLKLIEFGSGSSRKTRLIIEAILGRQDRLSYAPIDISGQFLARTAARLEATYPALSVQPIAKEYSEAMLVLPNHDGPRLFLFLGSNIGNFEIDEGVQFLRNLRSNMMAADRLQIGIDLVKDAAVIEPAYNDSKGVTEAFNKNMLTRINKELGGGFDLECFDHQAPYIESEHRVEMRLVSRRSQVVPIQTLHKTYSFREGEYIHTENSHKYTLEQFEQMANEAGLATSRHWLDSKKWFAELLLQPLT